MTNLITLTNPRSQSAEAFRTLRTNLTFSSLENPLTTLLVTSPSDDGDVKSGKSITLANLAVTFAQGGKTTILVDCDLRRPAQHELWNVKNDRGLSEFIQEGGDPVLQSVGVEGLSLLTSGGMPPAPADLNALVRECVDLKKYEWLNSGVVVEESYAPDLPPVLLKGPQFQQVVFNLLTNAEQALRLGGVKEAVVRVLTARGDGAVLVTVADNGPGVPPELKDKIWEAFFTTKPGKEGTGLGLSICRRIVTEIGGSIELDPPVRGRGASFTVSFPAPGGP